MRHRNFYLLGHRTDYAVMAAIGLWYTTIHRPRLSARQLAVAALVVLFIRRLQRRADETFLAGVEIN
tara:strand:- start:1617 stop:1817 length:201 start_codon:yes stop_codon:yes gene_type:complete